MRHPDRWVPSKYVLRRGRWRASRDRCELGIGSRLVADVVAGCYDAALPRFARGRLVDLGCGKLPLYGAYAGLVDSVIGVDWPQSAHANVHLDLEADLGEPLPFADASFDTAIVSDVLEHLPRPALLWSELARVLSPGGHALINVPFLYGLHEQPHDYYRYTEFALRRFAAEAGLRVMQLQTIGGSLHVLADLLAKHAARLPLLGAPVAIGLQAAVSLLDRTAAGRRLAERSGAHFPLGYFMVVERPALHESTAADQSHAGAATEPLHADFAAGSSHAGSVAEALHTGSAAATSDAGSTAEPSHAGSAA